MQKSKNLITTYDKYAFATNLKHARLAKGLSQADVAKATGLTNNAISLYESGENSIPSIDRAIAIANALKMPLDSLTDREAYCAGQLSTTADVAKTLLLLRDLGIAQVNVGDDANINVSIKDSDIADTLLELDSYIQMKQDGKTVSDGRFDGWYEDVYTQKDIKIAGRQFPTSKLSMKYKPFPQNMLGAAFRGESNLNFNDVSIDVEKLLQDMKDCMPERVYYILQERYQNHKTLEEVGNSMGLSREGVRKIEIRGLETIRGLPYVSSDILGID